MNPKVDEYLLRGCGRCSYYDTPDCKVNTWRNEIKMVRSILLECGLTEEVKWSNPCYTSNNKNILMLAAFKEACVIGFFKGTLLKDPHNVLKSPGKNSQASMRFEFTSPDEIDQLRDVIKEYVYEAIEIEKAGLKVQFKKEADKVVKMTIVSGGESGIRQSRNFE